MIKEGVVNVKYKQLLPLPPWVHFFHLKIVFAFYVACIDKWVKSKFEDATPPELCSGPKLAIWYKNQPPGPEKTPGHGEKSKLAILPLFGHAKVLGEKTILEYNNSY